MKKRMMMTMMITMNLKMTKKRRNQNDFSAGVQAC
jgi:hypothetical protein